MNANLKIVALAVAVGIATGAFIGIVAPAAGAAPAGVPSWTYPTGVYNCSITVWQPYQNATGQVVAQVGNSCGGAEWNISKDVWVCLDIFGSNGVAYHSACKGPVGPSRNNPVRISIAHTPTGIHKWATAGWVDDSKSGFHNTQCPSGSEGPGDDVCAYASTWPYPYTNH